MRPFSLTAFSGPEDWYRHYACNYPKFFKMDLLSKWAWVAAEMLLRPVDEAPLYEGIDPTRIAVIMASTHGCLDTDHRYLKSTETIPSPALFVYTLPNIMLGEICIRHGFKGEQLCLIQEAFDADALRAYAASLLMSPHTDACLYGYANACNGSATATFYWVTR